jgi:large subunit ribosomal protein L4e
MARGHKIDQVPEVPLVVGNDFQALQKTSKVYKQLETLGAAADVDKCKESRQIRSGKGKMRNRRYVARRGPLIVYAEGNGIEKAARNLPGVELVNVDRLNVLNLAPGGHLGCFCVWTEAAFQKLDALYGTYDEKSTLKKGFSLPLHTMGKADLARLINSDEIQSVVRPAIKQRKYHARKKNPLSNLGAMDRLNPYAVAARRAELKAQDARAKAKAVLLENKRKGIAVTKSAEQKAAEKEKRGRKAASRAFYNKINQD